MSVPTAIVASLLAMTKNVFRTYLVILFHASSPAIL